jgi:hypothetical protein
MLYVEWFLTLGGMVGGSIFLTQLLKGLLGIENDLGRWFLSLVSSEVLAVFGWQVVGKLLGFGIFVDTSTVTWAWESVLATGLGVTLVANNIFSLEDVKAFLRRLFGIDVQKP